MFNQVFDTRNRRSLEHWYQRGSTGIVASETVKASLVVMLFHELSVLGNNIVFPSVLQMLQQIFSTNCLNLWVDQ